MPLAIEFLKAIGDSVVLVNNTPYIYEGRLWVCDNTKRKLQLLIVNTLLPVFQKCYVKETQTLSGMLVGNTNPEKEKTEKNIATILQITNMLQTDKKQHSILNQVLLLLPDSNVEFDVLKPYYFVFNNTAFDFQTRQAVVVKREDYITQSSKYDYEEPTSESIDEMKKIMEEIHPDKDYRDCYTSVLRSGCIDECEWKSLSWRMVEGEMVKDSYQH